MEKMNENEKAEETLAQSAKFVLFCFIFDRYYHTGRYTVPVPRLAMIHACVDYCSCSLLQLSVSCDRFGEAIKISRISIATTSYR